MDTGSIQSLAPAATPVKPSAGVAEIAIATGVNSTRIEANVKSQSDNNSQNNPNNSQRQAPNESQYASDKGYIFQPGIPGVIYQVKDPAGKVIDQTPSKRQLALIAYEQKAASEDQPHATDTSA